MSEDQRRSDEPRPQIEKVSLEGVEIQVVNLGDSELLLVDGKPMRFRKLPNGYLLDANFYVKPAKSLMAAAKDYVAPEHGKREEDG
jgi:hypothetical protein